MVANADGRVIDIERAEELHVVLSVVRITIGFVNRADELLKVLSLKECLFLFLNSSGYIEDRLAMRRKSTYVAMELGVVDVAELSFIETARSAVCQILLLLQTQKESVEAFFVVELNECL
jgi:hypothetical protein